jgi:hypothetical protein
MKRKFKQWCSTMPLISTKSQINPNINSLSIKIPRHMNLRNLLGAGTPGGGVKSVN